MASNVQLELWHAEKVATQSTVGQAANGVRYAAWGETRVPEADLERMVGAVPATMSAALATRAYYFVPLAIADTGETMIAPGYSVELGDRAICHRNAAFGSTEAVFLSTRLVEDRFGLAFEFFINVAHNFVSAAGVPESFSSLVWRQAEAQVRGESSQDAWETRRRAQDAREGTRASMSARAAGSSKRRSQMRWRFTCCRSRWTSITTTCASASIRCWPRRRWRNGCVMWRHSFRRIRDMSSRFSIGARAERPIQL